MYDPHRNPRHIITNNLVISVIIVSHEDEGVQLWGQYFPMYNSDCPMLIIACNFEQLNDLLHGLHDEETSEYMASAEEVQDKLADIVARRSDDNCILSLCETAPLYIYNKVFALELLPPSEWDHNLESPGWPMYWLHGFIDRRPEWPRWEDDCAPFDKAGLPGWYNRLLAMQYGMFVAFNGRVRRTEALHIANLADPLIYELAKVQYELMQEEWAHRDADDRED